MEIPNKSKGEHYNLRWNSYTSNLTQVLLEHQHHENLVDVTLCCEGQFIKAHKLVLSACSHVFQEMFRIHNVQHPVVFLNGIKFSHFKHILEFIYQGEVKVLDIDLEGVLALGENLQVKGLSSIKLKHQVTSEELKNPALKQSTSSTRPNLHSASAPNPLSNSPALNTENVSDPNSKRYFNALPQTKNECNSGDKRLHPEENQAGLKQKPSANIKITADSKANMSKLETILTDLKETAERKKIKAPQTHLPTFVNNGTEKKENKTITSDPESEKSLRPASAFMIFANEWRKKLTVEHPDENNKAISIKLSNMWKSLSNETKQTYYSAAKKHRGNNLEYTSKEPVKKRKIERRKTVDSISHLVSVDLQEYDDDDDDLQIIEVNEEPIDVSDYSVKRNHYQKNSNNT